MLTTCDSGKLVEVNTETGTLILEWTDHRNGIQDKLRFNFGPEVELEMQWEYLIGRKVDVVAIDDKVVRVTELDEQAE